MLMHPFFFHGSNFASVYCDAHHALLTLKHTIKNYFYYILYYYFRVYKLLLDDKKPEVTCPSKYQGSQWMSREEFMASATSTAMKKVRNIHPPAICENNPLMPGGSIYMPYPLILVYQFYKAHKGIVGK